MAMFYCPACKSTDIEKTINGKVFECQECGGAYSRWAIGRWGSDRINEFWDFYIP